MKSWKSSHFCLLLSVLFAFVAPARGETVRVWQGTLDLPTYLLGPEDPNPPFPLVNRHRVYPYTMLDDLTDQRETKTYRAVFLENEYLKAIVLPDLGGHLYSLYDKANKREVFYRNHVVKYGLVALRGAWVSGGIEFNFPNGHTVATVSPVAFELKHDSDGGATVVIGDVDQVTEMHWEVALTLRPGQARLEQQVTLFNSTPLTNLYWYWANAAVPATADMQFIYPMREVYPHVKGVVWSYPLHNGVDYSWYKDVREPTSLFGRQVHRNFFGAYYHESDYGVVHVAYFRQVPGKKYWTWGVADDGLIWTDLLSDRDGAYNEIQAGRYETQLNYEFMPPRRVESFTEYWYPVQGLEGGLVEATTRLALNVNFPKTSGAGPYQLALDFSPAVAIKAAKVRVRLGTALLCEFTPVNFEPMKRLHLDVSVSDLEAAKKQMEIEVKSSDGKTLLFWSAAEPLDGDPDFVPAAGVAAAHPKPEDKMTVEELFLHGVGQEKDGDLESAAETYQVVLERDPSYVPALIKLTWKQYRAGDFRSAEALIARALARDSADPTVHYAAGVAYRAERRWMLAQDAFWAAIHFGGPPAPAYAQLGEIAIRQKNYADAAQLLRSALRYNPGDAFAATDLATALRLAGENMEAARVVEQALREMPLLPFALAEQWRVNSVGQGASVRQSATTEDWAKPLTADAQSYLGVAAWYRSLNDLPSCDAVLKSALDHLPAQAVSPLIYYYLASNARLQGKEEEAKEYSKKGQAAPFAKVFPNRMEDAIVLDEEIRGNPIDSHAQYFQGTFLFAHGRYEDGARLWSQALGEGFEYSVLMRNLGLYAWRVKDDLTGASGFYGSAIRLAPNDYRLYVDLDEILFRLGNTSAREKLFARAPQSVLEHDTVLVRRALLATQERQYDGALELLMNHRFKPWEGGAIVRQMFVLANVEKGRNALEAGKPAEAEAAFRQGLEYPPNLGVGRPDKPHDGEQYYWLGMSLKAQAKEDAAREAWGQAADEGKDGSGTGLLFRGLALRELGQKEEADKLLGGLLSLNPQEKHSARQYYVSGLADVFGNRNAEAESKLHRALQLDPDYWQARVVLDRVAQ
jgi:tetratricopeptide (TPR) repeat protein